MGGVSYEDEFEFPTSLANEDQARTVVLLGKTGNGKSSTGNSIIGKKVFEPKISYAGGITTTCEMQSTIVKDTNRVINVIDTPGLFYYPGGAEYIEKEIVKCIDMAKDGIHSFLVVLSVTRRFFSLEEEEKGVIESLKKLFGSNFSSYMNVVFTCADDLEEDETLYEYLRGSPDSLKEILKMCGNRCVLFDNNTKNAAKKSEQLHQLLALVDAVVDNNGGKPYTKVSSVNNGEMKKKKQECLTGVGSFEKDMPGSKEQLKIITEMVELKLRVATGGIEEQLAKERAARLKAEADAKDARKKFEEEIRVLRDEMERARLKAELDAVKKTEEEILNLRGEMERARLREEIDALKKTEEEIRVLRGEMERARLREEIDAVKKTEDEIRNLRDELERARLKTEAETKDAQHKADEELRILRGELERARLRAETETKDAQHKADEELRILRDELKRAEKERAEKEAEKERAEKETEKEKARKEAEKERARKEKAKRDAEKDTIICLSFVVFSLFFCFLYLLSLRHTS